MQTYTPIDIFIPKHQACKCGKGTLFTEVSERAIDCKCSKCKAGYHISNSPQNGFPWLHPDFQNCSGYIERMRASQSDLNTIQGHSIPDNDFKPDSEHENEPHYIPIEVKKFKETLTCLK